MNYWTAKKRIKKLQEKLLFCDLKLFLLVTADDVEKKILPPQKGPIKFMVFCNKDNKNRWYLSRGNKDTDFCVVYFRTSLLRQYPCLLNRVGATAGAVVIKVKDFVRVQRPVIDTDLIEITIE